MSEVQEELALDSLAVVPDFVLKPVEVDEMVRLTDGMFATLGAIGRFGDDEIP